MMAHGTCSMMILHNKTHTSIKLAYYNVVPTIKRMHSPWTLLGVLSMFYALNIQLSIKKITIHILYNMYYKTLILNFAYNIMLILYFKYLELY